MENLDSIINTDKPKKKIEESKKDKVKLAAKNKSKTKKTSSKKKQRTLWVRRKK